MYGVKLNEIDGLILNKQNESRKTHSYEIGFNECINEQGNKEITLNRDRLAKMLWELITKPSTQVVSEWDMNFPYATKYWKPAYYAMADAILADLKNIIEVKK